MNKALKNTIDLYNEEQIQAKTGKGTTAESQFNLGSCPRSVDEVYSLGIKLQYYVGGLYLEMIDSWQGNTKKFYQEQTMRQLAVKNDIQSLANENLNQLLAYFYDNGGPIIEPPVSEQAAREIQPFFNRIASSAMDQITRIKEEGNDAGIVKKIDDTVADMYSAMARLFNTVQEVSEAFSNLAELNKWQR